MRTESRSAEALLLAAVWFGPLAFGAVEPWSLALLETLLFSLCALSLLVRPPEAAAGPHNPLLAAVIALAALGVLQRLNPRPLSWPGSWLPFTAAASRTGPAALQWGAYAALLWGARRALPDRRAARRLAWTVFLVGTAVAVIGLMQSGQGNGAYYGLRPVRHGDPFGPYPDADHAASLMVMSFCAGLGLWLARLAQLGQSAGLGRRLEKSAILVLMLFLLGVTACGIRQTQSRGGLISLAVAVCAVGLLAAGRLRPSARQAARGLVLAAAAGFGFYLHLHPEIIGRVFSAPDNSTAERLSMYRSGLRMLGDFPVWGVGLGSAQSVFPAYQEAAVPGLVEHLHCDWLELAVTAGIVGAACYVAAFLLFLGRMRKLWLSAPSREMTALAFGALAAILAFAVHGLVDFSFQIPANAVVFLALAALLEASLRLARVPEYEAPRPRTPFLAQGGRE